MVKYFTRTFIISKSLYIKIKESQKIIGRPKEYLKSKRNFTLILMCFGKAQFNKGTTIGGKELKNLKEGILKSMPEFSQIEKDYFAKNAKIAKLKVDNHLFVYTFNGKPLFFQVPGNQVCPNLILVLEYPDLLPCVYVDEGAVRALLRGADLMAPGIKQCPQEFEEGQVIAIRLLDQEEAFAIGVSVVSSEDIKRNPKNTAIEIKHILKDALWEARDGI